MRALWRASRDEHNNGSTKILLIALAAILLALVVRCADAAPQRDSAPVLLCDRVLVPDWERFSPDDKVQYVVLPLEEIEEIWMHFGTTCYPDDRAARDRKSI